MRLGKTAAVVAGIGSGFFGGLVGNQGGIRTGALLSFDVEKEKFIATATAIAIVVDKPFVVGDSISVENYRGKVENIGLKTTRVRSESGEQIIFSNGELLKSKIRNYSR